MLKPNKDWAFQLIIFHIHWILFNEANGWMDIIQLSSLEFLPRSKENSRVQSWWLSLLYVDFNDLPCI